MNKFLYHKRKPQENIYAIKYNSKYSYESVPIIARFSECKSFLLRAKSARFSDAKNKAGMFPLFAVKIRIVYLRNSLIAVLRRGNPGRREVLNN